MTSVHHDTALADDDRRSAAVRRRHLPHVARRCGARVLRVRPGARRGRVRGPRSGACAGRDVGGRRTSTVLADLKPRFIHHPRSKELLRDVLQEQGCDLESTYFDVPRLRTSTSGGYLTSGLAYAWHPHRDTWYSAPMGQLNYWMPVYPIEAGNAMAFHPHYFDVAVPNSSADYNYYEWNTKYRAAASSNVEKDTRPLPGPIGRGRPPGSARLRAGGGRAHPVLRPAPALECAQPQRTHPLLDRLPDGAHRRHRGRASRRRTSTSRARARRSETSFAPRTSRRCPSRSSSCSTTAPRATASFGTYRSDESSPRPGDSAEG